MPVRLGEQSIKIVDQLISQFDGVPADRLDAWPESPGLLIDGSDIRVITEERRKRAQLRPACEKLACRVEVESSNVCAAERDAADAQVQQHLDRIGEMLPRRIVIPRPNG